MSNNEQKNSKTFETGFWILVVAVTIAAGAWEGALYYFRPRRSVSWSSACVNNLRQIDGAKQQWAIEFKKSPSKTPTTNELLMYIKTWPECPQGGRYTINDVSNFPTCSIGGEHVLP